MSTKKARIRDPIHGTLRFDPDELAVIDHPAVQRLRGIKQLGLADLAFPGATHSRYAHALGTTHIATRMLEQLARDFELLPAERQRMNTTLRLAAMFHDIGHAPLSHTTERFMPPVNKLGLGEWQLGSDDRRACHEDFTLAIILKSDLSELIRRRFADRGIDPEDLAVLLSGRAPPGLGDRFQIGGRNWLPLLRQCVSSELDADRMDYLLRDSYYAGVPYGRFDLDWLIENLRAVERGPDLHLGLHARGSFGFEDYLLSRYHMFLSVYLHHVPVGYELMLRAFHESEPELLRFPPDPEQYLECDDVFLLMKLRGTQNPWARRLMRRKGYKNLTELRTSEASTPAVHHRLTAALAEAGIHAIAHTVKGKLSKYFNPSASQPPVAVEPDLLVVGDGAPQPIENFSPLYQRYAGALHLHRVYVEPERHEDARPILRRLELDE
ncbi:MAG: HD domain-containing protein [Myxococcota bacterium]